MIPSTPNPAPFPRPPRVRLAGVDIDPFTEQDVIAHVVAELNSGRGGHIITPNIDICASVAKDPVSRRLLRQAEVVVADGMPLVWASKLRGTPLPERVTGADLIWSLSKAAARHGFPVYLLGGPPGVAEQAADELGAYHPGLEVCGVDAPPYDFAETREGRDLVRRAVIEAEPRIAFVGLGFPKQDRLIASLRDDLPDTWFVGCGSAIAFAAGTARRAPEWMRASGLEWMFRLLGEPGRLAGRYLIDDLPFAARLLTRALTHRLLRHYP
ncbi:WecB/TagA/CpsF family glycosyltransferase [Nonomuraea sp. NPDC046570]|uniref:WecB/TagA/CpsF family glycosyltransferase n=1 Tax=Nonomuraea sp. NPDC046570 TaxID=3155255 RepID=UPI003408A57D